jgi:hypothetical protein
MESRLILYFNILQEKFIKIIQIEKNVNKRIIKNTNWQHKVKGRKKNYVFVNNMIIYFIFSVASYYEISEFSFSSTNAFYSYPPPIFISTLL